MPLILAGKGFEQHIGDHERQHAVTEELQPLVAHCPESGDAAVRQGSLEQCPIAKVVTQETGELGVHQRTYSARPTRRQSIPSSRRPYRSDERRGGNECVSTCRSWCSP